MGVKSGAETLLLLDTCGDQGSIAIVLGERLLEEMSLPERTASGALLGGIRECLAAAGLRIGDLDGIGVVNGPGSFTGLRVGLAMAKGLCEASDLRMAAVSRLAVLAEAGELQDGFAALAAGRGQVYVREMRPGEDGVEGLIGLDRLVQIVAGRAVVFAEESLRVAMQDLPQAHRVGLTALSSLASVRRCLAEGGSELQRADANYVRHEEAIYARQLSQR